MIAGQEWAVEQFARAWGQRRMHHAWLLAGPRGVGKATFARAAATRVLAEAAGLPPDDAGLGVADEHPTAKLIAAGAHPDMRWVERIENPKKPGTLYRDILVEQVREIGAFLSLTPALSPWRVVVIDPVDELQAAGANALLKMLEEPPPSTLFLLVSHAPGRLLPTIRSRCRRLDFGRLDEQAVTAVLAEQLPDRPASERAQLAAAAQGSAGRAMALAELDLLPLEQSALRLMREGDPINAGSSALATELARKTAGDRYAAFLDLLPGLVAAEARRLDGPGRQRALEAYGRTRELTALAPRLALDPAATVFQLGGILATVAAPLP